MIDRANLDELITQDVGPIVSIYMDTHRGGPEKRHNPIRLESLLATAEEALAKVPPEKESVQHLLSPAVSLLQDEDFWLHPLGGLALFVGPGLTKRFHVPADFDELVVTGERPHILPLIPVIEGNSRCYILALSQKKARLFEIDGWMIEELEAEGMHQAVEALNRPSTKGKNLQFHTGTRSRGNGRRAALYHGHGKGKDDRDSELRQLCRAVDRELLDVVPRPNPPPLILASVDELMTTYREVTEHPNVLDEGVSGNPDVSTADELLQRAYPILEQLFREQLKKTVRTVEESVHKGEGITDLAEVLRAAHDGRIETLLVAEGEHQWGLFHPTTRCVTWSAFQSIGTEDLLNLAAVWTLQRGGGVSVVPSDGSPRDPRVAALLRY